MTKLRPLRSEMAQSSGSEKQLGPWGVPEEGHDPTHVSFFPFLLGIRGELIEKGRKMEGKEKQERKKTGKEAGVSPSETS